jgi:hypothetical protein
MPKNGNVVLLEVEAKCGDEGECSPYTRLQEDLLLSIPLNSARNRNRITARPSHQ